jgi:hypothetical protein
MVRVHCSSITTTIPVYHYAVKLLRGEKQARTMTTCEVLSLPLLYRLMLLSFTLGSSRSHRKVSDPVFLISCNPSTTIRHNPDSLFRPSPELFNMSFPTHHESYDGSQLESPNTRLSNQLTNISDASILRHFFGFPIFGAPQDLHEAAIVCLNVS